MNSPLFFDDATVQPLYERQNNIQKLAKKPVSRTCGFHEVKIDADAAKQVLERKGSRRLAFLHVPLQLLKVLLNNFSKS